MNEIDRLFATRKVYRVGSPEFQALMKKNSDEAFKEETQAEYEEYVSHEDMMGRLPVKRQDK